MSCSRFLGDLLLSSRYFPPLFACPPHEMWKEVHIPDAYINGVAVMVVRVVLLSARPLIVSRTLAEEVQDEDVSDLRGKIQILRDRLDVSVNSPTAYTCVQ